ncbi:MAG: DMT family transporter [Leptospiraceae bacterium]|nr:DMT family transporter [Leptospiraceae bacterium]
MILFAYQLPFWRQLLSPFQLGILLNLASALSFYMATFFLKKGSLVDDTPSWIYAFARYLFGMLFMAAWLVWRGTFRVERKGRTFVLLRSIFNVLAVLAFYYSVELGHAGMANVLNMTYPIFVVLLAGPMLREWPSRWSLLITLIALSGVLLNFPWSAAGSQTDWLAILAGLFSGITAAIAVVSLRGAVQAIPVSTIMFWMFACGALTMAPVSLGPLLAVPARIQPWLLLSALMGLAGQWFLAVSYRYLEAPIGSIVSSSRILFALLFGVTLLHESYSGLAWGGALMIAAGNVLLALHSRQQKNGNNRRAGHDESSR